LALPGKAPGKMAVMSRLARILCKILNLYIWMWLQSWLKQGKWCGSLRLRVHNTGDQHITLIRLCYFTRCMRHITVCGSGSNAYIWNLVYYWIF
jgi:hypothetical protein